MTRRTYSELMAFDTLEGRFEYLALKGFVGERTFGGERWINQDFYRSKQWRDIRNHVIARDYGFDMGLEGFEIYERPVVHHMNPMTRDEIAHGSDEILDPEFLITVSHNTHNAIHYGDFSLLPTPLVERLPGDTRLWSRG